MNRQLKGIIYILFGILLVLASIGMKDMLTGNTPAYISVCGLAGGIVGLILSNKEDKSSK